MAGTSLLARDDASCTLRHVEIGNSLIADVRGYTDIRIIGSSRDDAAGEDLARANPLTRQALFEHLRKTFGHYCFQGVQAHDSAGIPPTKG